LDTKFDINGSKLREITTVIIITIFIIIIIIIILFIFNAFKKISKALGARSSTTKFQLRLKVFCAVSMSLGPWLPKQCSQSLRS
jgi:hypothetical protein